jgi:hypothetical protein
MTRKKKLQYFHWQIYDAPDGSLIGRLYRGADLANFPPSFMPNGTVFKHQTKGTLKLFWDGRLMPIQSLDDPVPTREGVRG